MSDSLSQNQTTCPTQAFSVSNSDSLCHNHLLHILLTFETCVLSLVILLLPWLIRYSLSQSQTVCLELRQYVPCTSCWHMKVLSGNQSLASRVLRTVCLKVGQSVWRSLWRQFVSCTSCKHVKVVSCVLWYFWCLDSFCTLCLNIRQSSLKSDRLLWNRTVCPVLTIALQLWYHRYVCTRASMSAYIVVS